jgi:glycerol-3-phosphate cytidylyltransferase-like family protein
MRLVAAVRWVDRVVAGDPLQRYFSAIRRLKPDVIAVGHDQPCDIPAFRVTLRSLDLPHTRLVRLKEYQGHRYHSSTLRSIRS